MHALTYCGQNLSFVHPDHLCFDQTTCDNIIGPAGPLAYLDQIFRDTQNKSNHAKNSSKIKGQAALIKVR